jgi:UDP-N-acetylmuramoyl-L-alanyl-D-glutamate--2,6-diaminopimelate ligase
VNPRGIEVAVAAVPEARISGPKSGAIVSLAHDSRSVVPGSLFAAIPGTQTDGHRFVVPALAAGAVALVVERPVHHAPDHVTVIEVPDARRALARIAAAFHGEPSRQMALVGVTGTNGKTTITYLVEAILQRAGLGVGAIGTTGIRLDGRVRPATHTTPEGPALQAALAEMLGAGADAVVMEISSHALQQGRAVGCHLDVAAFVNLSRDHLDFHGDMQHYLEAKQRIVTELLDHSDKPRRRLVVNADDEHAEAFAAAWPDVIRVSGRLVGDAEVRPLEISFDLEGMHGRLITPAGEMVLESSLVGSFNLVNVVVATGIARALDIPQTHIAAGLRAVRRIPGRLEPVRLPPDPRGPVARPAVLVDYAHSPDALQRVLAALRPLVRGRIVTVFGCGGDRDRGKRPLMGAAAAGGSDLAVVTTDNPRGEDPDAIIEQILPGVLAAGGDHRVQPDRRLAIGEAVACAGADDLVLVAGKGHERVQVVGDRELRFDDRDVSREALARWGSR